MALKGRHVTSNTSVLVMITVGLEPSSFLTLSNTLLSTHTIHIIEHDLSSKFNNEINGFHFLYTLTRKETQLPLGLITNHRLGNELTLLLLLFSWKGTDSREMDIKRTVLPRLVHCKFLREFVMMAWHITPPIPYCVLAIFWIRLLENFFPGTVGSHLADTSLLWIPRHWRQESVSPAKRIKKWLKLTLVITDSLYYGNADTFMPPPSRNNGHLSTSSKILTHMIKCDITTKENKQTVLQLDANMKCFLFAAGFCPVHEAALESFC